MALNVAQLSSLSIGGSDWVGEARRQISRLAHATGFQGERLSRIELVVTEMATNLVKHATDGRTLRFGVTEAADRRGLLILSEDKGPGIARPDRAAQDHFSTSATLGGGLGAIRRLSDEFYLVSETARPGRRPGTLIASRHWLQPSTEKGEFECEALTQAKPGERENGDGVHFVTTDGQLQIAVIDGLGHGLGAHQATEAAKGVLRHHSVSSLSRTVETLHQALHGTQGAVVGILRLDPKSETAHYIGVGNIDCRIYGRHPARPVSMNGSLGVIAPRLREESYRFGPDDFFILSSDGLSGRWDLDTYAGFSRLPMVARAGLLLKDFGRAADDATVAVGGWC